MQDARTACTCEYATGEREYYDLRRDPFELSNVAASLSPAHLLAAAPHARWASSAATGRARAGARSTRAVTDAAMRSRPVDASPATASHERRS